MITIKLNPRAESEMDAIQTVVADLRERLQDTTTLTSSVGGAMLSTESIDEVTEAEFVNAIEDLDSIIGNALTELHEGDKDVSIEDIRVQADAAAQAALLATNPKAVLSQEISPYSSERSNHVVLGSPLKGMDRRTLAIESFDDTELDSMITSTTTYNMFAASPSEFVRANFPIIVMGAKDTGFKSTAHLRYVQDDVNRDVNGKVSTFNRRSLTRAAIDPTILSTNKLKVIPVWRTAAADKFIDVAVAPTVDIVHEGQDITTSWLKPGVRGDIIGLSQTNDELAKGQRNYTDQLDPDNQLSDILIKVGNDLISFNVEGVTTSAFSKSPQEGGYLMNLSFNANSIQIDKLTKDYIGGALDTLSPVVTGELTLKLSIECSGNIDIDTGEYVVYGLRVEVNKVYNSTNDEIPLTSAPASTIVGLFADAAIVGFKLNCSMSNSNHRVRGDTIGNSSYTEERYVRLGSPITVLRPTNYERDSSDLATLISTTHLRMAHEAVRKMGEVSDTLRAYTKVGIYEERPEILGLGRLYVKPTHIEENIDVLASINSITSHERSEDIKAVLVNILRDTVTRMYIESEMLAAKAVIEPTSNSKPTVTISTDPYIASYLYESGDERLLTDMFNAKVVTSPHEDMVGKMYIVFSDYSETRNSKANLLSFGNCAYSPEVVFNLQVTRGNATTKELSVYPRFEMINNCPVLGLIHVTNIKEALRKIG